MQAWTHKVADSAQKKEPQSPMIHMGSLNCYVNAFAG
jgi:hypothetical protein